MNWRKWDREYRDWGWKVLLAIAFVVWFVFTEYRFYVNLELHNITFDTLEDHTDTQITHIQAIDRLERIHLHELEELEEVRKWEEYYDTPAGDPKPTESKDSK
ncbi:MAG: hypothetical protein V3S55_13395 [Nitrospiraceae bacterium]